MLKKMLNYQDIDILSKYGLEATNLPKAQHITFSPGEYISRGGESLEYLYFVVSGKAKVLLNLSDGRQLLLAYFISQGIIGDVELMTDVIFNHATLQAVTQLECIALPLKEYKPLLKANNTFINYVGKELAEKLMQRAINGAITTLQPLESRLAAYIFQTAVSGYFDETLTEVAAMVGASYRHLLRCFNQLCENKILEKKGKTYQVINTQALMKMSGDLYVLK